MYGLLAAHPQILAPTPKEPGYWAWPSLARVASEPWYVRSVLHAGEACSRDFGVATFDATAYYLQWDSAVAAALRRSAPWTKIVLLLREPISRAMSWLQHMAVKFPNVPNCLHHADMECCVAQSWFTHGVHHLGGGMYHHLIRGWLDAGWDLGSFHVARFEDILDRGIGPVYADILNFLELDTTPAANLTAAASAPANRRSSKPYNMSLGAYITMVDVVKDDVKSLEALLHRDFGWAQLWAAQEAQCERDGACRVSLLPPPHRRTNALPAARRKR